MTADGEEEDKAATDKATAPKHDANVAASTTCHEIENTRTQAPKCPTMPQP